MKKRALWTFCITAVMLFFLMPVTVKALYEYKPGSEVKYKNDDIRMVIGESVRVQEIDGINQYRPIEVFVISNPSVVQVEAVRGFRYDNTLQLTALKEGSATIHITQDYETDSRNYHWEGELKVQVLPEGSLLLYDNSSVPRNYIPSEVTVRRGSYVRDVRYSAYGVLANINGEVVQDSIFNSQGDYKFSFSDPSVLDSSWKALKKGTTAVTFEIQHGKLAGMQKDIQVTVTEEPKCGKTTIRSQVNSGSAVFADRTTIAIKVLAGDVEYQIYRSKKKDSGYKLIQTFDSSDTGYNTPQGAGVGKYFKYDDYNLKANTKYYYKVKTRFTDETHDNSWSTSEPVAYWTAAKPLPKSSFTFNKETHVLKIKKYSGAKGYIYHIKAGKHLGYNIFGQSVIYSAEQDRVTTKTKFTTPKKLSNAPVWGIKSVIPITKHGDYYYANGHKPTKKMSTFKSKITDRKGAV